MTHAELRARLRAYADGTLALADAEAVRVHLASGCEACLRELFARPVGLPRPRPGAIPRPRQGQTAALVAAAAGLGLLAGTLLDARRQAENVEVLEAEVAGAGLRTREMQQELERTRARLADAERRVATSPPVVEAVADPDTTPAWLEELLSSSGARAVPLRAAPLAPGARGYALWSPSRDLMVVVASDLPRDDAPATYRVRVLLDDQSTVWVGDLGATDRGALTVTVALPERAGRGAVAVDLYRDPPGTPALTARLRP